MTKYRIRKRKGSKIFWIEKCIFTFLGIGFFCMPHGKRMTGHTARHTTPFYYPSMADADREIRRLIKKDQEYRNSKTYKGAWI